MKLKEVEIEDIWSQSEKVKLADYIKSQSNQQSKERVLRNQLLAIRYKIEDYIQNENDNERTLKILDFVKLYLDVLNITKKEFAEYLDMRDSNLHKYLSGERKLNAKIVLKLSAFSHTKPEYWYRIQIKNELMDLNSEKGNAEYYKKYDYKNLVSL